MCVCTYLEKPFDKSVLVSCKARADMHAFTNTRVCMHTVTNIYAHTHIHTYMQMVGAAGAMAEGAASAASSAASTLKKGFGTGISFFTGKKT